MLPLTIEHVSKRYGGDVVVDDLTFTVAPGRVTCFLGPNGAGKSTTMKILLDLARADDGYAAIGGTRYRELANPARAVGVVLEPNAFHPACSGRNHLMILAEGAGIDRGRIAQMLDAVALTHSADRHVGDYSLGMRQRLGLAAALLGDPPVLVLDEPGNGLDPQGIRWLRDLLRDRAAGGGSFTAGHGRRTRPGRTAHPRVGVSRSTSAALVGGGPRPPCSTTPGQRAHLICTSLR